MWLYSFPTYTHASYSPIISTQILISRDGQYCDKTSRIQSFLSAQLWHCKYYPGHFTKIVRFQTLPNVTPRIIMQELTKDAASFSFVHFIYIPPIDSTFRSSCRCSLFSFFLTLSKCSWESMHNSFHIPFRNTIWHQLLLERANLLPIRSFIYFKQLQIKYPYDILASNQSKFIAYLNQISTCSTNQEDVNV